MAKYAEAAPIILKAIEEGETNKAAAEKAGIHIDTYHEWMKSKPEFSEAVRRAREAARERAVQDVEASLLKLAKGYEYEDMRTEYEGKLNPETGKTEPVIKKQVRVKHVIPANTEAIKFFLTNKAPDEWKNRQDTQLSGDLLQRFQSAGKVMENDGSVPTREEDIPD